MKLISETVVDVLKEKLQVPESNLCQEFWDLPLTGTHFKRNFVDLVYLLFELEATFDVRISEDYLVSYRFNSINSIVEVLETIIGKD